MKRGIGMWMLAAAAAGWLSAQTTVENAQRAAVRTAALKELWRVKAAVGAPLAAPTDIQTAADSVYLQEGQRLLQFSADGVFRKNLLSVGNGAGQVPQLSAFVVEGGRVILHCIQPPKLVELDAAGKLAREVRYNLRGGVRLLFATPQTYYLVAFNFNFDRVRSGDPTQDQILVTMGPDGRYQETDVAFRVVIPKLTVEMGGGRQVKMAAAQSVMTARADDRAAFAAYEPEYAVEKIDLRSNRPALRFRRKYERVGFFAPGQDPAAGAIPGRFFVDVMEILAHGSDLWVVTSTVAAGKGVLVDVFNAAGKYTDAFWLPLPGIKTPFDIRPAALAVSGDSLYCIEADGGAPALVKYQLSF